MEPQWMQLADLPPMALVAGAVFTLCFTGLLMQLLAAPQRDCFFFRWQPETRFFALFFAPCLLILWPFVLMYLLVKHGIIPADSDD